MDTSWNVVYDSYDTENESLREALCALGNGYFATRGAHEESKDNGQHYPGTYLAGGYNRLKSEIGDKIIENEDLVNWPNWLLLKFRAEGGEWVDMDNATILEFEQKLNLREGFLERRVIIKDREKRETEIVSKRFVHMKEHHLAGIQWKFTPRNWDGKITIHSALDGSVINNGVARYRDLESRHLKINETGFN